MEDPAFDRHGLTPVTVLNQAMSGLAHLHSLNIGKMNLFFEDCANKTRFSSRRKIKKYIRIARLFMKFMSFLFLTYHL